MELIIGNKKYSSWSFRPWILMKVFGIPFSEIQIFIREEDSYNKIRRYSPGGRVPVLVDGKVTVWESLAICEYLSDKFPKKFIWPKHSVAKAVARSICHEMHAGFQALRQYLPCHFFTRYDDFKVPEEAKADIERMLEIWRDCRAVWGKKGDFLFGNFSIADAMYAPVVYRFRAYGIKVDALSEKYMKTIEALSASQQWVEAAKKETQTIPAYENIKR